MEENGRILEASGSSNQHYLITEGMWGGWGGSARGKGVKPVLRNRLSAISIVLVRGCGSAGPTETPAVYFYLDNCSLKIGRAHV